MSPPAPFTVLHLCLGNICRSPMAERLLSHRFAQRLAKSYPDTDPAELLRSHSVGTGDWYVGEPMSAGSATQLARLGASAAGFAARTLEQVKLAEADLILTATARQQRSITYLAPGCAGLVFSLLQFGRLAGEVALPVQTEHIALSPAVVRHRAQALIAGVTALAARERANRAQGGADESQDDLTDPFERGEEVFAYVADQIDYALAPLVAALVGESPHPDTA